MGGGTSRNEVVARNLVSSSAGLFVPLIDADGEPGDMVVNAEGVAVPIYGNEAHGHAIYNPIEGRKLFKSWLSHWGQILKQVPCLTEVPVGGTSSFVVSLMSSYAETHHPKSIESDELDPNKFICYVASHIAEFGRDLELLIQKCPALLDLPYN